jgi:DNA primase
MGRRPHRPISPAELEAREAVRAAKLDALHATLTEQIAALRTGQDWQQWLAVAARFHNYSFNNVLLIAAQRPGATAVAGCEAWKTLGRQVDKGERGIQILAPVVRRTASADPPAADPPAAEGGGSPTSDQIGNDRQERALAGGARRVAGFRVAYVFDVTQTSGAPLPDRPVPRLLAGQAPAGLWDALAEQVHARGFALQRGPCLGGVANGLTNYLTRTVTVRADVDDAQAVKTLAHELAHVLLHDPTAPPTVPPTAPPAAGPGEPGGAGSVDPSGQCRGRVEVEAESVAYLVTASHGLDSGGYTFPYVAGWAGSVDATTPETVVRATGQRVLTAAHVILAATQHLHAPDGPSTDVTLTQAQVVHQVLRSDPPQLDVRAERGAQQTAALRDTATLTEQAARTVAASPRPAGPQLSVPGRGAGPDPERLIEVHELAAAFYRSQLSAPGDEARRATEMLARRGVDAASAIAEGLGYAPRAWTRLLEYLRGAGVLDDELLASGLTVLTARGTLVDRFRDRLVFPVRDESGRTIALLGRAVNATATDRAGRPVPKYLNSPDTDLYRKGEVLYGLDDRARAALASGAIPVLVEGPMDVRAVNLAGAHSPGPDGAPSFVAAAPCGTALTAAQVALLDSAAGGLAQHGVVVAFDGDAAGRTAAVRAFELLRTVRAWPHALDLPDGQDPAGMLQQQGPADLHAALRAAAARPLADLVVDERLDRYADRLQWAEGKVAAGRAAAAVVASLPTEQIGRQIVRLVARLDLPAGEVSDLVVDAITSPSRGTLSPRSAGAGPRPADRTPRTGAVDTPAIGCAPASAGPLSAAQRARAGFPVPLASHLHTSAAAPAAGLPSTGSGPVAGQPPAAGMRRHA